MFATLAAMAAELDRDKARQWAATLPPDTREQLLREWDEQQAATVVTWHMDGAA